MTVTGMTAEDPASGFVDLHTHVLASVDDGPASLDDALEVLRAMAQQGVTTVAATSHVSASYPNRSTGLAVAHQHLADAAKESALAISILRGAEVEMTMAMTLSDEELAALCTEGTRWLLVETPHSRYPAGLVDIVRDLRRRRFEVLVAHPERNPFVQKNPDLVEAAVERGALVQLTGASLRGALGRSTAAAAWRLLEGGLAHVVASDSHNVRSRPPDMDATAGAVSARCGSAVADAVTRSLPAAIVAGKTAEEVRALADDIVGQGRRRRWLVGRR